MIKGIIFDLDGTLADTMGDLQTAMNGMLSYLGYSERSRTDLLLAINNGAREFVRRSLPKDVQDIDFILNSAISKYEDEYSKCYDQKTAPYDGVEEMLMNLKMSGIKLAVLSNKQDKFVKDIINKLFDKKTFTVEVHLNSNVIGKGKGKSKKQAEQMAAKQALSLMGAEI